MMPLEAMEQERMAFLYELYTRTEGDARQGVPYEALIDALGFGEALTKRLQRELQQEGLVELTTVPPMTHVGRPVMDHEHRHSRQQTIGMTLQGVRLMEDIVAKRNTVPPQPATSPDPTTAVSRGTPRNPAGIIGGVPRTYGMEGQAHASRRQ